MINEEIARLTGKLVFKVDYSGLIRFEAMLKSAERQMMNFAKANEALQKKLNRKFGVTGQGANAAKLKADASVQQSLTKQLATEAKLSRLRRQQFAERLAEQKLIAAGTRQEAFLQSASLKDQVQRAVLASKQHAAEQASLKTELGRARLQATAEQSKIREARYADILQRRQARTLQLQRQAAMHQTRFQRAEAALGNARASGIRQAERFRDSKLAAAAREARAQLNQDRAAKRFDFSAERHAAWQAKQAQPESVGLSGLTVGIGAAGAALYGLTSAIGYLSERINKRQETASDNQQFDNTLLAAGNNDKERVRIREAYIANSQEFGMKIDRESAVAYSNMVQGFRAQGKTLEEAIQLQKDQAAVFRIGNLDKTQQYSAALQLNQGYSKDRFMGQDLRPLTDALGTRLTTILYQAIGKALGYEGDKNKLAGFVLEAQHDGKVNGKMVQQGMRDIVAQSPELLERHKRSLDAQAVRVENDQYLRSEGVNKDPELIDALGQRLDAERQLIASATTLQESLKNLDMGLVKMQTGMLRLLAGKNADDSVMTPDDKARQVAAAGFPEGMAIDPSVMGGRLKQSTGEKPQDPINRLFRWFTNSPDYDEGPANKVRAPQMNTLGMQFPKLDLSKLRLDMDMGQLAERIGEYQRFRPDTFEPITSRDMMRTSGSSVEYPVQQITTTNEHVTNNNNTVSPSITINVNAVGGDEALGKVIGDEVDARMQRMLRETQANQKELY